MVRFRISESLFSKSATVPDARVVKKFLLLKPMLIGVQ
jgi:hypothetical protein